MPQGRGRRQQQQTRCAVMSGDGRGRGARRDALLLQPTVTPPVALSLARVSSPPSLTLCTTLDHPQRPHHHHHQQQQQQQQQRADPGGSSASALFAARLVELFDRRPIAPHEVCGSPEARAAERQAAAAAAAEAAEQQEEGEEAAQQRHLAVPLGFAEAAGKLGLAAGSESAAEHASSAVAHLSSQLGGLDVGAADPGGAAANGSAGADAAASGSEAGEALGRSLEYLRYSIESGVASGFQLAAAAGPLCDEPLWGLAFQVEARLNLPPAGEGGGSAAAAAASLQLAEDVYGPFSGQVRRRWAAWGAWTPA